MQKLSLCEPLDKLLGGGLEHGCITNFYGPSASGKTNVGLLAVVSCVRSGKKTVFIDTEGSFSVERITQIADNAKKITDNVVLLEPKNWEEQVKAFRKIAKIKDIGLVVVDSISALWRLTVSNDNYQDVNRELATELSLLSKLAREQNIPVLITNQVYDDTASGRLELSGKNIVKWWSKNLIELMHAGQTSHRFAIVRKARAIEEDKKVEFMLVEKGIEKPKRLRLF